MRARAEGHAVMGCQARTAVTSTTDPHEWIRHPALGEDPVCLWCGIRETVAKVKEALVGLKAQLRQLKARR
jgi:hypothetical protein